MTDILKKIKVTVLIGILLTLIAAVLMYLKPSFIETLEEKTFDYRFKLRGSRPHSDTVVIAAIDEKSLDKLGRWPWSRDKLARLVSRLSEAGAGLIVFDIILSENEKNDKMLGDAIWDAGNVILPIVFDFEGSQTANEDKFLTNSAFLTIKNPELFKKYTPILAKRVLVPVPALIGSAMTLGHINMFPDNDGTLRWESLVVAYNGYLFPSVTLDAAVRYLGVPWDKVVLDATKGIRLDNKRYIPTDIWGRSLINYYGSNNTFRHFAISDILEGAVPSEDLKGKIVLVGASAVGIYDLRVTPFSPAMPGVEKHASVIESILGNKLIKKASSSTDFIILLSTGILFSLIISRYKALYAAGMTLVVLIIIAFSGYFTFSLLGIWINITYSILNVLMIFGLTTAYSFAVEERYAKRIRSMFSSYVTERVVNELIKNPGMAQLGGDRREITVLFSDIRGFTTFSEKHAPEDVVATLNEYLGAMTGIVFRWEGTLDKFIGDAILAFWGAPMKQENHAELAVKCSLDMMARLCELQKKWAAEGKEGLDIGIGINTGEVLVGNIGAEGKKMDYTVIGDNVNLGSRVESLTKKYHAHILITEFTLEKIRDKINSGSISHVNVKGLEKVIVKGKEKPVGLYELKDCGHGSDSCIMECDEEKVVKMTEK